MHSTMRRLHTSCTHTGCTHAAHYVENLSQVQQIHQSPDPGDPEISRNPNITHNLRRFQNCAAGQDCTHPAGPQFQDFAAANPDRLDSQNQNSLTARSWNSFLWVKAFSHSGPAQTGPDQVQTASHGQKHEENAESKPDPQILTFAMHSTMRTLHTSCTHTGCTRAAHYVENLSQVQQIHQSPDPGDPEISRNPNITHNLRRFQNCAAGRDCTHPAGPQFQDFAAANPDR